MVKTLPLQSLSPGQHMKPVTKPNPYKATVTKPNPYKATVTDKEMVSTGNGWYPRY